MIVRRGNPVHPATVKGDLLVYNGSDFKPLAVGANDKILTADSAEATGLRWATAGAGSATDIYAARSSQAVVAGTAIVVTDGEPVTRVTMTGNVTMTAAPTIAAGREGQLAVIVNDDTADNLILSDAGVLAGSLLRLGASTRTLTPGASLILVYDATIGAWIEHNYNTLVTITPAILTHTINIGAGASNSQNAEVAGSGTHTPTFAWTYTGVPSAGTVDVSAGGDPGTDYPATILTPFTSLVGPGFNKGTSVGTVRTFTPTITVNGVPLSTPTATVTYINRRYAGPNSQATMLSSAQILALDGTGGVSGLSTTQYGTFVVDTLTGEYFWFAYRSALTDPAYLSIEGEIAGFTIVGLVSHTNDSVFVENFDGLKSVNTNIGAGKTFITSSSRPTNRIYMGPHTGSDITDAQILTLDDTADGESVLSASVARTYTAIKIEAGEYLWFCHPDVVADLATIKDASTGFGIDGAYQADITHVNQWGYSETYRRWRSTNTGIFPTGQDVIVT